MIARTSDHGELGMSHGGLRQKMFNAYEETIRIPLVVSNPRLFPEPRESDALVSLVDIVPTLLGLSGEPGDADAFDGVDLGPLLRDEADDVRDAVLFTYDDHQAGHRARRGAGPAQPDPLRARQALEVRRLPRPGRARRRPSSSSTTSMPIPTRRSTSSTARPGAGGRGAPRPSARACTRCSPRRARRAVR